MKITQFLLLLASLLSYTCEAADGPLPVINFELIADGSKIFSDESGRFTDFISAPTVSGETVYFVAKREQGTVGIYSNTRSVTKRLVDTQSQIPDGKGHFAHFETAPMGTGHQMVFQRRWESGATRHIPLGGRYAQKNCGYQYPHATCCADF